MSGNLRRVLFRAPRGVNKLILFLQHAKALCFLILAGRSPARAILFFYTRPHVLGCRATPGAAPAPAAPAGPPAVPAGTSSRLRGREGRDKPRRGLRPPRGGRYRDAHPTPPPPCRAPALWWQLGARGRLQAPKPPGLPPGRRALAPAALPGRWGGGGEAPTCLRKHPTSLPGRPPRAPRGSQRLPSVKLPGRPQGEAGRQEEPQGELHGRRGLSNGAGWPPRWPGVGSGGGGAPLPPRCKAG